MLKDSYKLYAGNKDIGLYVHIANSRGGVWNMINNFTKENLIEKVKLFLKHDYILIFADYDKDYKYFIENCKFIENANTN